MVSGVSLRAQTLINYIWRNYIIKDYTICVRAYIGMASGVIHGVQTLNILATMLTII